MGVRRGAAEPVVLRRGVLAWLLVMSLVSPMAVALGGVWYTGHVERTGDRQWCELLNAIDRPPDPVIKDPATRARNLAFVGKIHRLRVSKGCADR
jgi:hypothetical protein